LGDLTKLKFDNIPAKLTDVFHHFFSPTKSQTVLSHLLLSKASNFLVNIDKQGKPQKEDKEDNKEKEKRRKLTKYTLPDEFGPFVGDKAFFEFNVFNDIEDLKKISKDNDKEDPLANWRKWEQMLLKKAVQVGDLNDVDSLSAED